MLDMPSAHMSNLIISAHDELCNVDRVQSAEVGASNISYMQVTVTVEGGNVGCDLSVRPSSLF